MAWFAESTVWHLVSQADSISKAVLTLLILLSIACWVVFLYKLTLVRLKKQHVHRALEIMHAVQTTEDVRAALVALQYTVAGKILSQASLSMQHVLKTADGQKDFLTTAELELFQQLVDEQVQLVVEEEYSLVSFLAIAAETAPLIGLFGTVWGIMHSFIGISEAQSADIATVAPGIAEALITTLAGLVVAVPAMVMYHYLLSSIRSLEQMIASVALRYESFVVRLFMR